MGKWVKFWVKIKQQSAKSSLDAAQKFLNNFFDSLFDSKSLILHKLFWFLISPLLNKKLEPINELTN